MTRVAATIVLFAALAMCAPANAVTVPGERVMTDPVALHEVAMGIAWWQQHGITGCPGGVSAKVAPEAMLKLASATAENQDDGDVEEIATVGGCELWLASSTYGIYKANKWRHLSRHCRTVGEQFYCDRRGTVADMRDEQSWRCSIIRHGLGHAIGGLDDNENSADDDVAYAMEQGITPNYADCDALARATWRYRPAPRHRGHGHLEGRVLGQPMTPSAS